MSGINSLQSTSQSYEKPLEQKTNDTTEVVEVKEQAQTLSTNDNLQTYKVKKGDTLWGISKDKLGNPQKWTNVFDLNKEQIKDPNLIYPDQVLKLPIKASEAEKPVEPVKPVVQEDPKPVDNKPAVDPVKPIVQEDPKPVDDKPAVDPVKPIVQEDPKPVDNKPSVEPVKNKQYSLIKVAGGAGLVGTAVTAGTFVAITSKLAAPAANLGGYATAQIVAKNLTKVGISLGGPIQVSKMVKAVGGPKVAGAIVAVGVGVTVAGIVAGAYHLHNKSQNSATKEDPKPVDNKSAVDPIKPIANSNTSVSTEKPNVSEENKQVSILKVAGRAGLVGTAVTAGSLIVTTSKLAAPVANLGGYATAQIVAKNLTKIGISLGGPVQVSKMVSAVGGPKVAGAIVAVGVGVTVAGIAAGSYHLYNKSQNK